MKGMRNIAPFGLRMPDELREALQARAKANGRSMNSEIVQILQDAIDEKTINTTCESADFLFSLRKDEQYKIIITKEELNEMIENSAKVAAQRIFQLFDSSKK